MQLLARGMSLGLQQWAYTYSVATGVPPRGGRDAYLCENHHPWAETRDTRGDIVLFHRDPGEESTPGDLLKYFNLCSTRRYSSGVISVFTVV